MEEQHFVIKGVLYASTDDRLQEVLGRIHETPERPRCMCVAGGIEMYVARHRLFVIKRMPDTGCRHHPVCPSYQPEMHQSGLGELMGEAVIEHSPESVELRVDFPFARTPGLTMARGERQDAADVELARRRMSLRAVMHFLFERAGLNRWTPAMEGKRNQGVLHKYLTEAAEDVMSNGLRLSERLYVPEPFSETGKAEIAQRRRSKLAPLQAVDDAARVKLALVLGEFKGSEATASGRKVWIKHMPDTPLFIDTKTWQRIERVYASLFEARDADAASKPRIVICALICARREHTYQIEKASLMLTSAQWIPLNGVHEIDLIQALVEQRRRFVKPLQYDAKSAAAFPNALLLDAGATPLALHVVSGFMSAKDKALKQKTIKDMVLKSGDGAPWVWSTDQPMPSLQAALIWTEGRR